MSRNKEKAQSGLNRYLAYKNKEAGVLESNPNLRPKYVQSVDSLAQADKWRSVVLREISTKLTRIQDPSINESLIRELNDSLNKLFKEKRAWEYHIKDLGGNDYINFNTNRLGIDAGKQLNGYRYFGRAKDLPDVKELILAQKKSKDKKDSLLNKDRREDVSIQEKASRIDISYYGFDDDFLKEDDELVNITGNDIINQINEILGEEVISPMDTYNDNYGSDNRNQNDLISYETKRSEEFKIMHKFLNRSKTNNEISNFEVEVPKSTEVTKWIIDKKRRQLIDRLNLAK